MPITPRPNLRVSFAANLCFSKALRSSFQVTTLSKNLTKVLVESASWSQFIDAFSIMENVEDIDKERLSELLSGRNPVKFIIAPIFPSRFTKVRISFHINLSLNDTLISTRNIKRDLVNIENTYKKDSLIQNDSLFQIAEAERHYNLGVSFMQQNNNSGAIAEFNQALSIMPNFAVAKFNRGMAYFSMNQNDKAKGDFIQVLEMDSTYHQAHFQIGLVQMKNNQMEQAFASYSEAIALNKKQAKYFYYRGMLRFQQNEFKEAIIDTFCFHKLFHSSSLT